MKSDSDLIAFVAAGGKIDESHAVPAGYRAELLRLLAVFVDSELAGAAGFAAFINTAPGLKARAIAARIVSEKFGHAERGLALMTRFGVNPDLYVREHAWDARLDRGLDLGTRRVGGDKRLNVFHHRLEGWIDAVTLNLLMGSASAIQLGELTACSYAPLAAAMNEIAPREARHARWGENGIKESIAQPAARVAAQAAVDYWFARVAATFGRSESSHFELHRKFGLRWRSNADLLARWRAEIGPRLLALHLVAPA